MVGSIGYRHYTRGNFDNQKRASLLVNGDLTLIRHSLKWSVADRLTNAPIDPLVNAYPGNIQLVNVAETGPTFSARLSDSQTLNIGANYARVWAEETPIDHDRRSGVVSWSHDLTSSSNGTLYLSTRSIEFDDPNAFTDFDQHLVYYSLSRRTLTTDTNVALGGARTSLANGFEKDNTIGWLRLGMQRTSNSDIYAEISRTVGDPTTALVDAVEQQNRGLPLVLIGSPYVQDDVGVRYTRGWGPHTWSALVGWRQLDFFNSGLDQTQRRYGLFANLFFTSRLNLVLIGQRDFINYKALARTDHFTDLGMELNYRLTGNWSLAASVHRYQRTSSDVTQEFVEMTGLLSIRYWSLEGGV
jgi:hypothetical protein